MDIQGTDYQPQQHDDGSSPPKGSTESKSQSEGRDEPAVGDLSTSTAESVDPEGSTRRTQTTELQEGTDDREYESMQTELSENSEQRSSKKQYKIKRKCEAVQGRESPVLVLAKKSKSVDSPKDGPAHESETDPTQSERECVELPTTNSELDTEKTLSKRKHSPTEAQSSSQTSHSDMKKLKSLSSLQSVTSFSTEPVCSLKSELSTSDATRSYVSSYDIGRNPSSLENLKPQKTTSSKALPSILYGESTVSSNKSTSDNNKTHSGRKNEGIPVVDSSSDGEDTSSHDTDYKTSPPLQQSGNNVHTPETEWLIENKENNKDLLKDDNSDSTSNEGLPVSDTADVQGDNDNVPVLSESVFEEDGSTDDMQDTNSDHNNTGAIKGCAKDERDNEEGLLKSDSEDASDLGLPIGELIIGANDQNPPVIPASVTAGSNEGDDSTNAGTNRDSSTCQSKPAMDSDNEEALLKSDSDGSDQCVILDTNKGNSTKITIQDKTKDGTTKGFSGQLKANIECDNEEALLRSDSEDASNEGCESDNVIAAVSAGTTGRSNMTVIQDSEKEIQNSSTDGTNQSSSIDIGEYSPLVIPTRTIDDDSSKGASQDSSKTADDSTDESNNRVSALNSPLIDVVGDSTIPIPVPQSDLHMEGDGSGNCNQPLPAFNSPITVHSDDSDPNLFPHSGRGALSKSLHVDTPTQGSSAYKSTSIVFPVDEETIQFFDNTNETPNQPSQLSVPSGDDNVVARGDEVILIDDDTRDAPNQNIPVPQFTFEEHILRNVHRHVDRIRDACNPASLPLVPQITQPDRNNQVIEIEENRRDVINPGFPGPATPIVIIRVVTNVNTHGASVRDAHNPGSFPSVPQIAVPEIAVPQIAQPGTSNQVIEIEDNSRDPINPSLPVRVSPIIIDDSSGSNKNCPIEIDDSSSSNQQSSGSEVRAAVRSIFDPPNEEQGKTYHTLMPPTRSRDSTVSSSHILCTPMPFQGEEQTQLLPTIGPLSEMQNVKNTVDDLCQSIQRSGSFTSTSVSSAHGGDHEAPERTLHEPNQITVSGDPVAPNRSLLFPQLSTQSQETIDRDALAELLAPIVVEKENNTSVSQGQQGFPLHHTVYPQATGSGSKDSENQNVATDRTDSYKDSIPTPGVKLNTSNSNSNSSGSSDLVEVSEIEEPGNETRETLVGDTLVRIPASDTVRQEENKVIENREMPNEDSPVVLFAPDDVKEEENKAVDNTHTLGEGISGLQASDAEQEEENQDRLNLVYEWTRPSTMHMYARLTRPHADYQNQAPRDPTGPHDEHQTSAHTEENPDSPAPNQSEIPLGDVDNYSDSSDGLSNLIQNVHRDPTVADICIDAFPRIENVSEHNEDANLSSTSKENINLGGNSREQKEPRPGPSRSKRMAPTGDTFPEEEVKRSRIHHPVSVDEPSHRNQGDTLPQPMEEEDTVRSFSEVLSPLAKLQVIDDEGEVMQVEDTNDSQPRIVIKTQDERMDDNSPVSCGSKHVNSKSNLVGGNVDEIMDHEEESGANISFQSFRATNEMHYSKPSKVLKTQDEQMHDENDIKEQDRSILSGSRGVFPSLNIVGENVDEMMDHEEESDVDVTFKSSGAAPEMHYSQSRTVSEAQEKQIHDEDHERLCTPVPSVSRDVSPLNVERGNEDEIMDHEEESDADVTLESSGATPDRDYSQSRTVSEAQEERILDKDHERLGRPVPSGSRRVSPSLNVVRGNEDEIIGDKKESVGSSGTAADMHVSSNQPLRSALKRRTKKPDDASPRSSTSKHVGFSDERQAMFILLPETPTITITYHDFERLQSLSPMLVLRMPSELDNAYPNHKKISQEANIMFFYILSEVAGEILQTIQKLSKKKMRHWNYIIVKLTEQLNVFVAEDYNYDDEKITFDILNFISYRKRLDLFFPNNTVTLWRQIIDLFAFCLRLGLRLIRSNRSHEFYQWYHWTVIYLTRYLSPMVCQLGGWNMLRPLSTQEGNMTTRAINFFAWILYRLRKD